MNDMIPFHAPTFPEFAEFLTAREIADQIAARGVAGFPGSERGVRAHAEQMGWNALPVHLSRWRAAEAKGGRPSREYHVSLLPQALRDAVASRAMQAAMVQRHQAEQASDHRKIAALRMAALSGTRREVMLLHQTPSRLFNCLRLGESVPFGKKIAPANAIFACSLPKLCDVARWLADETQTGG